MGEVYFIRHGQASYGAANYDKLSDLGHQQSEWLGAHLARSVGGFDRVIHGSLRRHRETLAGIEKSVGNSNAIEDERLNEMSYFMMERVFTEKHGTEVPREPEDLARHFVRVMKAWEEGEIPDEPESYTSFQTRVLQSLMEHARLGERVLLVSSGGPKGVALRHVLGLDLATMTNLILLTHNASVSRFAVSEDGLRLLQFNGISHLEQSDRQHAQTFL